MTVSELAGPVTSVSLNGRLDAPGADAISVRFTAAVASPGRDAIVDLSGVAFVASMGLRLLIATARALGQKGGTLVLHSAPPLVREVFEDAALDQIIPLAGSAEEALARLGR